MNNRSRLARLESQFAPSRDGDRAAYCRDCGGLSIDEALTQSEDGTSEWGKPEGTCRRCGRDTLAGVLAQVILDDGEGDHE